MKFTFTLFVLIITLVVPATAQLSPPADMPSHDCLHGCPGLDIDYHAHVRKTMSTPGYYDSADHLYWETLYELMHSQQRRPIVVWYVQKRHALYMECAGGRFNHSQTQYVQSNAACRKYDQLIAEYDRISGMADFDNAAITDALSPSTHPELLKGDYSVFIAMLDRSTWLTDRQKKHLRDDAKRVEAEARSRSYERATD